MTTTATIGTVGDLVLRKATLDDAGFVADMYTAIRPDDPEDPVLWRHYWANEDTSATLVRFIALRDGRPVGLTGMQHAAWDKMPQRYARILGELVPELRTRDRLGELLAHGEELARRDGALRGTSWTWEWDRPRIDALTARGYTEERRQRFWELDLVANRAKLEEMARASRERMHAQGVRVLTVAEDTDPEKYRRIWRMSEEAEQDIPTTVPHVPTTFEVFRKWFESPAIREDRMWIARVGDDVVVGISALAYPPVRGVVATDWTGQRAPSAARAWHARSSARR